MDIYCSGEAYSQTGECVLFTVSAVNRPFRSARSGCGSDCRLGLELTSPGAILLSNTQVNSNHTANLISLCEYKTSFASAYSLLSVFHYSGEFSAVFSQPSCPARPIHFLLQSEVGHRLLPFKTTYQRYRIDITKLKSHAQRNNSLKDI